MSLEVPQRTQRALAALLGASLTELDALAGALESLPPMLVLHEYIEEVGRVSQLPPTLVSLLLPLVGELQQVVSLGEEAEAAFATELIEASGAVPGVPEELEPGVHEALVRLLKARNVFIANKAGILQSSRQLLFRHAEIVTDLTPVFETSVDDGPAGFVIRHMFRITASQGSDPDIFEIAVDLEDIGTLKKMLDRATSKHEVLLALLRSKELSCIN